MVVPSNCSPFFNATSRSACHRVDVRLGGDVVELGVGQHLLGGACGAPQSGDAVRQIPAGRDAQSTEPSSAELPTTVTLFLCCVRSATVISLDVWSADAALMVRSTKPISLGELQRDNRADPVVGRVRAVGHATL